MARHRGSVIVGVLALLALASPAGAQSVFIGGGATLPMGDYKDYAKTGWIMTAGVSVDLGEKGLFFEAEGFFGSNKHKATAGTLPEKTNLMAGIGAFGYSFGQKDAKVRPYVLGGVGLMNHQFRSDDDNAVETNTSLFAYTGAAGLVFAMGPKASVWTEARYLAGSKEGSSTAIIPITVGISLQFGGN